jgi:hypothetical protein
MEVSKYSKLRKVILLIGIVVCLVTLLVVFPIEYAAASYISDFKWTYPGLAFSVLFMLYGFTGHHFMKYLFFIFGSTLVSGVCWYLYSFHDPWVEIIVLLAGLPAGIVTALVFFVLRYFLFLRNKERPVGVQQKNILLVKQGILYFVLLVIVSVIFLKGGDWWFELFQQ